MTPIPDRPLLEGLRASADEAAPGLLGALLVSDIGGVRTSGRIVEVEAYLGPEDPASHAAIRAGRTARNAPMFGAPGTAYVYFIYGMHWCFNVVTGAPGLPQAVLIRALEPVEGETVMRRRRNRDTELASGPGRLCRALGIDGSFNERSLDRPPLRILSGGLRFGERIAVSGRIGVRAAADRPLRFYLEGHPDLSVDHGRPQAIVHTGSPKRPMRAGVR